MTTTTIPRVARPRGVIPDPELTELLAARAEHEAAADAFAKAEARLHAAMDAAFQAGGSHVQIATQARIAKSTVQKYVKPRGQ